MRRVWFLILLALLLAGCAELRSMGNTETPTPVVVHPTPTPEMTFSPETSTAARIQARGALVVGVRYDLEPFSYVTTSSELVGLEVDLTRELARRWLGTPDAVQFIQVRSDTAVQHLEAGTVDFVLAGMTHTQHGEAEVDFSVPYFINGQALLTFPEAGIQGLVDLQGRNVGVLEWTGSEPVLEAAAPVSLTVTPYTNFFDVVEALRVRQIDVYSDMRHRLVRAQRTVAGSVMVGQYTWEPVSVVYRQNDPFFANLINLTLQDMRADGTLGALYDEWLPGVGLPDAPLWPGSAAAPSLGQTPPQLSTRDVVADIRASGVLTVGYVVDRWPYTADRADGTQTGFEVRLLERIAERWLGSRQALRFVPVTAQDGLQRLAQGDVHLLVGGWIHTREAELRGDFSIAFYDDGVSLFSRAGAPVTSLADLNGAPVGVIAGSAGEAALPTILQQYGVGVGEVTYPTLEAALDGLRQGAVGALLAERGLVLYPLYYEAGFALADARLTYRPVGFVTPEGDSAYRDLLSLTLMAMQADGTYGELYRTWYDDPLPTLETWPGSPVMALTVK